MFRLLTKKMRIWLGENKKKGKEGLNNPPVLFSKKLAGNLQIIRELLGESNDDVVIRELKITSYHSVDAAVVYIDGLADREMINRDILQPLMFNLQVVSAKAEKDYSRLFEYIHASVLTAGQINTTDQIDQLVFDVISGKAAILAEGTSQVLIIDVKGWEKRALESPTNEVSLRGPRDSFTETLRTNTALLRRKIRDPRLTFEKMYIGQRTKTAVVIAYIKELTAEDMVEEVRQRLGAIETSAILDAGYIEQFIEDSPASLFPTVGNSERPDVVTARMLEGRTAILVDGSPMVLTVPFLFFESFQNPDDYYARPFFATAMRWLRFLGILISIYLPGIYVALSTFHQELLPTPLLITVAASREGIPFPAVVEALMMLVLFEILREAGLRMPRSLGQAVSIVGALVIGQSAVSAGIVGAPMVIVVAATAITSFLVISLADAGALLRLVMTIAAGALGLLGLTLLTLEILSYVASLRSFGVPYLSPVAPVDFAGFKDLMVRAPLWAMDSRPAMLKPLDLRRQSPDQMPRVPQKPKKQRSDL